MEMAIKEAKVRTKDIGGTATMSDMGNAIVQKLKE
jgi:isocitrate/isopropylmalate dehydrogenase